MQADGAGDLARRLAEVMAQEASQLKSVAVSVPAKFVGRLICEGDTGRWFCHTLDGPEEPDLTAPFDPSECSFAVA